MNETTSLPDEYVALPQQELEARVRALKTRFGKTLCILGHHYQSDDVVQFADFVGDSLKLSQQAALRPDARFIVFCGVHFMAESADILAATGQTVCLPNALALCAMADMADDAAVATAIEELAPLAGPGRIVPITYVNSSAATKAVTARAGGACCTSSNAVNVFAWALKSVSEGGAGGDKIFAIPDQHLGRNCAVAMGCSLDDCAVYDPSLPAGGLSRDDVRRARFILWKGQCYVHQVFRPADIEAARAADSDVTVIVHPECPFEVVRLADAAGSTEQIIRAVSSGPPGGKWAVGTEANLVRRLARRHPDRTVRVLGNRQAHCVQMARITLAHLLWVLDGIDAGKPVNVVSVPPEIAQDARTALERMIAIKAAPEVMRLRGR